MEKSASFPAYNLGTTLSAQCYLGIEPLLQRAASTGDAELLLTLLKVRESKKIFFFWSIAILHDLDRQCSNGGVFTAVVIVPFTENGHYVYTISNNSATFKTILCTQITYLFSKRQCRQLCLLIQKRGKLVKIKYVISTYLCRYQK